MATMMQSVNEQQEKQTAAGEKLTVSNFANKLGALQTRLQNLQG